MIDRIVSAIIQALVILGLIAFLLATIFLPFNPIRPAKQETKRPVDTGNPHLTQDHAR